MENLNPDVRDKAIGNIVKHIDRAISYQQEYRTGYLTRCAQFLARNCCLCWGKTYGNYLTTLHILTKLLYAASSVSQLFFLGRVIGNGYLLYGFNALQQILKRKYYNSQLFPLITLCDFEMRQFSNVQLFTVQCALPINMFNEKAFLFIWLWLCVLSFFNVCSLVYHVWVSFRTSRTSYVLHHLRVFYLVKGLPTLADSDVREFVTEYLRQDGALILRLIEANANDMIIAEVTGALHERFLRNKMKTKAQNDLDYENSKNMAAATGKHVRIRYNIV